MKTTTTKCRTNKAAGELLHAVSKAGIPVYGNEIDFGMGCVCKVTGSMNQIKLENFDGFAEIFNSVNDALEALNLLD